MGRRQAGERPRVEVDAGELGDVDVHLVEGRAAASMSAWSRRSTAVNLAELVPRRPARSSRRARRLPPGGGAGAEVEAHVGELGAMTLHLVELGHVAAEGGAAGIGGTGAPRGRPSARGASPLGRSAGAPGARPMNLTFPRSLQGKGE
ncbi:hypothetical protein WME94_40830 [Sorangium sp. So ce429]